MCPHGQEESSQKTAKLTIFLYISLILLIFLIFYKKKLLHSICLYTFIKDNHRKTHTHISKKKQFCKPSVMGLY